MTTKLNDQSQKRLPRDGCSRWAQFAQFLPICRETFRRLSNEGKAPRPIRMGIRCTFYKNKELHRFLANPLEYKVEDA